MIEKGGRVILQKLYSLFTRRVVVNTARKEPRDVEPLNVFSKAEQYEYLERHRALSTVSGRCIVVDFGDYTDH